NEGFASYMEYVAVSELFPEWNIWTQFVYMDHSHALELDGLKSTHPIEVEVNHPAEISEIFDEVSYSKGASVIRMLAEYLGYKNFRDGLRHYLKTHSYKNASTTDLWIALEKISGKPVSKIMKNWTGKPGYPLLTVELKNGKMSVTQKRFFASVFSQKTTDKTLWQVPLEFVSNKKEDGAHLLTKDLQKFAVKNSSWIKLNKNETSFARVRYSKELLERLRDPILNLDENLSQQDRFGVVRDTFVLSEAGLISTDLALKLSQAYMHDESYIVWADIAEELSKIKNLLFGTDAYEDFQKFGLDLFSEIGDKVGWEKMKDEDHSRTLLRSLVLGFLGSNGDKKVITHAKELFKLDQEGTKKIPSDLRSMVYVQVARNGGVKEYNLFLEKYKKEEFQEEKDRLLRALCAFKDPLILQKVLDFAFTTDVKAQDSFKVIAFVAGNPYGRDLAWKKTKVEWDNIAVKFGGGHLFTRFIKPFAVFTNVGDAKEIQEFFKLKDSKGLERTIEQVLEQIKSNAEWKKRDLKKIQKFLKEN
ncbi:MAG: ERAP1-like C-terminal domain-containing protein, partial [Candidatus Levybacteria bacterium]|nr:ERAP1-like C-terminal domain-containing protein [Candidatus Levybacteria bacterium]